jgi:hypothetical protein
VLQRIAAALFGAQALRVWRECTLTPRTGRVNRTIRAAVLTPDLRTITPMCQPGHCVTAATWRIHRRRHGPTWRGSTVRLQPSRAAPRSGAVMSPVPGVPPASP